MCKVILHPVNDTRITFFKKLIGVTLVIRWDAVLTIYDGQGKILFYLRFD